MWLPFLIFWIILILARRQLGWRRSGIAVAVWLVLLIACSFTSVPQYLFVACQAILDVVLILAVFGGDIRIN